LLCCCVVVVWVLVGCGGCVAGVVGVAVVVGVVGCVGGVWLGCVDDIETYRTCMSRD